MSLIKKLLDTTTLSKDICNIISHKIYKSNYLKCINEYSLILNSLKLKNYLDNHDTLFNNHLYKSRNTLWILVNIIENRDHNYGLKLEKLINIIENNENLNNKWKHNFPTKKLYLNKLQFKERYNKIIMLMIDQHDSYDIFMNCVFSNMFKTYSTIDNIVNIYKYIGRFSIFYNIISYEIVGLLDLKELLNLYFDVKINNIIVKYVNFLDIMSK